MTNSSIDIIYWKVRIFFFSLRWIKKINIGDRVIYLGKEYTVINGSIENQWKVTRDEETLEVSRASCRKSRSITNYISSFRSGWNFYTSNWLVIWLNQGIQPWMRELPIWGAE